VASFGHELTIDLAAPPAAVWNVIADYTRDPEWRADVRMTVEPRGLVREGTITEEALRMMGAWHHTTARICDVEPGHAFRFISDDGRVEGTRRVTPIPAGTRLTVQIRVEVARAMAVLAPLLGWLFRRRVRRDLGRLAALKDIHEHDGRAPALG
jgi:uncharacterized protein YndB with AHSA1/START domain